MKADSSSSTSADRYAKCPIAKTHRRLVEAHLLWHQTLDKYHDSEPFRANLNATIEALRNVTWVLQKQKAVFAKFEEWYGRWQDRMRADVATKWVHDARNTVVHQGELESESTAEVRLVTWRDEVLTRVSVPAEMPSSLVLQNVQLLDLVGKAQTSAVDAKYGAIAIERRWSTTGLGGRELLEVLAKAYGLVSDVVLDAHFHLKRSECISKGAGHPDFRSAYHRTGVLECMAVGTERRTELFELASGDQFVPGQAELPVSAEPGDPGKRYGFTSQDRMATWEKLDPLRYAEKILYQAKRILQRDGYHQRMMFIRDGGGRWHMNVLIARDRTEKHLLMRLVAQFVESRGCDAIVEVGEMWSAPLASVQGLDLNQIQDAKGRGELLMVAVVTRQGISRRYTTPFWKGRLGSIKLGDTRQIDGKFAPYLEPVLDVWRRQGSIELAGGKVWPRLWEPDALDTCFCGGPRRFAECCRPHFPRNPASRVEIRRAMAASDFARAEQLSRADLAQYVIWVKQHTAPTMHVAKDFHRKIVDIDVHALEDLVETMEIV